MATRFVVLSPPIFDNEKLKLTVSPGSIALFAGEQLSAVSVDPEVTIIGTPWMQQLTTVFPPLVTITLFVVQVLNPPPCAVILTV